MFGNSCDHCFSMSWLRGKSELKIFIKPPSHDWIWNVLGTGRLGMYSAFIVSHGVTLLSWTSWAHASKESWLTVEPGMLHLAQSLLRPGVWESWSQVDMYKAEKSKIPGHLLGLGLFDFSSPRSNFMELFSRVYSLLAKLMPSFIHIT